MTNMGGSQGSREAAETASLESGDSGSKMVPGHIYYRLISCGDIGRWGRLHEMETGTGGKSPFPWRGLWGIGLLSFCFLATASWAACSLTDSPPQLRLYHRPKSIGTTEPTPKLSPKCQTLQAKVKLVLFSFLSALHPGHLLQTTNAGTKWKKRRARGVKTSKVLQAGSRLTKVLICKHGLFFMKNIL